VGGVGGGGGAPPPPPTTTAPPPTTTTLPSLTDLQDLLRLAGVQYILK
jgi:hypothetical protein